MRVFNSTNVYYKDNEGMYVLKVGLNGKIDRSTLKNIITKDFCMTTVSINGCLAYLSEGKCLV